MLRRNGLVQQSVESVLKDEKSLRWEGFVRQVGFKPEMKVSELWMRKVVQEKKRHVQVQE